MYLLLLTLFKRDITPKLRSYKMIKFFASFSYVCPQEFTGHKFPYVRKDQLIEI